MIQLVPLEQYMIDEICHNLREHDKKEFALFEFQTIQESIDNSAEKWCALVDNKPACMWGIRQESLLTGASIWLISTPLIEQHPYRFLVESRRAIKSAVDTYFMLYGYVDADYAKSSRWLEWLGFDAVAVMKFDEITLLRYELRAS